MQEHELWLENPPKGTEVCLGFDGSENDDWTCIKAETREGFIFTPRYGEDRRPTIWNPKTWGGRIPRSEVNAAMDELNERYKVIRAYCDPGFRDEVSWESQIEAWDTRYGPKKIHSLGDERVEPHHRGLGGVETLRIRPAASCDHA